MFETGHKKFDLEKIKNEVKKLQGGENSLYKEIDDLEIYLQKQNKLLEAKKQQISKASRQINDLISLIQDKIILIRRLKSEIDWMHNRLPYKVYSRTVGLLKIFRR